MPLFYCVYLVLSGFQRAKKKGRNEHCKGAIWDEFSNQHYYQGIKCTMFNTQLAFFCANKVQIK